MRADVPSRSFARELADQAFSRASGAPLRDGNAVVLLKDAAQNYPAWLDAIRSARRTIHFEMYIVHDDRTGGFGSESLCGFLSPCVCAKRKQQLPTVR